MEKVNHPSYYNSSKYEVIDVIEDWQLNFSRGNTIKYIARAGRKNPETEIEDLQKAAWYLNREIERLQKHEKRFDSKGAINVYNPPDNYQNTAVASKLTQWFNDHNIGENNSNEV